ncbi:MAG: hypothetical protein QMD77_02485 [Patescibacteria group bacterium]|nr:hypothetical protein [Patescibacteria group bacterium]
MKKTIWVSMIAALVIGGFMPFGPFAKSAEAKNYRSRSSFSVTGDGNNADASIVYVGAIQTNTNHYRRVSFSGLKMANPFSFRVFGQDEFQSGLGSESWSISDRYFITSGNLWFYYGNSSTTEGNTIYSDYSTGNRRYFSYYGGTKKKKRKNSAYKAYEFTATGTESDADTTSRESSSGTIYYYRKVSVPELDMDNLVDYRLYSKNDFPSGFSDESWMLETDDFFIADGALYVAYGAKYGGSQFYSLGDDTFRFFTYSDGKRKKNRLTKQYVKKYQFSVSNDPNAADKVAAYSEDGYTIQVYYKKVAIKGAKITDYPNVQVMKKNDFISGYTDESWSQVNYTITDGYLWATCGYQIIDPDGTVGDYENSGSGDYQAFSYK